LNYSTRGKPNNKEKDRENVPTSRKAVFKLSIFSIPKVLSR